MNRQAGAHGVPLVVNVLGIMLLGMGVSSCEKVIPVDLDNSDERIVVQGEVKDQIGAQTVLLTRTENTLGVSSRPPVVSGALVTISDGQEKSATLVETSPGRYSTQALAGTPGRTYTLRVESEGKVYEAVSVMPENVPITSITTEPVVGPGGQQEYAISVRFKDPPTPGNFYRLEIYGDNRLSDVLLWAQLFLHDDKLANGTEITWKVNISRGVAAGDTLRVELHSIDRAAYEYFRTLNDLIPSARNLIPLSPANPTTNATNGALGFFAAYAVDVRNIIL